MINFVKVPSEYLLRFAHHPDSCPLPPTETSEGERRGLGFSEAAETKWRMNETSGESDAIATDASRVFAGKSTFEIQIFHQKKTLTRTLVRWNAINVDPSTEPSQHPQVARQRHHLNHLNHH